MTRPSSLVLGLLALAASCSEPMPTGSKVQLAPAESAISTLQAGLGDDLRAVPRPCPAPGTDGFDFWVGEWQLRRPTGELFATTIVSEALDGCVVMEDFINTSGNQARSLSAYDAATGTWHQIYQDNLLGNWRLAGGVDGMAMELASDQQIFNFTTQTFQHRDAVSTWTPGPDGTVAQRIVGTLAGTPLTFFDARYEPVSDPVRAQPSVFPFCQFVIAGFRQLDFWLGDWEVLAEHDITVGDARVTTDLNGCMVQADFRGVNGLLRRSFLVYDFPTGEWYRYMAANTGEFVKLSGPWVGAVLTLTGIDETASGRSVEVRNTVRPAGDRVVETWETKSPSGSWRVVATGRYRRRRCAGSTVSSTDGCS